MTDSWLSEIFDPFDDYVNEAAAYRLSIETALGVSTALQNRMVKLAANDQSGWQTASGSPLTSRQKLVNIAGGIAQLWKSPMLPSAVQRPSTLGQALVLGSLGGLAGYGAGRLFRPLLPKGYGDPARVGALLGAGAGLVPAALTGLGNYKAGKPLLTSSLWDDSEKPEFKKASIDVRRATQELWNNPAFASQLPVSVQAAASGLVQGAANLPGKPRGSRFVTPMDITRIALGMGAGAISANVVGKTMGLIFGTSPEVQKRLIQTGAAVGLLKSATPMAFNSSTY